MPEVELVLEVAADPPEVVNSAVVSLTPLRGVMWVEGAAQQIRKAQVRRIGERVLPIRWRIAQPQVEIRGEVMSGRGNTRAFSSGSFLNRSANASSEIASGPRIGPASPPRRSALISSTAAPLSEPMAGMGRPGSAITYAAIRSRSAASPNGSISTAMLRCSASIRKPSPIGVPNASLW